LLKEEPVHLDEMIACMYISHRSLVLKIIYVPTEDSEDHPSPCIVPIQGVAFYAVFRRENKDMVMSSL